MLFAVSTVLLNLVGYELLSLLFVGGNVVVAVPSM